MSAEQMLAFFSAAGAVSTGVCLAGFGFAVFAFFRFRIPEILSRRRSGRSGRKKPSFVILEQQMIVHSEEKIL